MKPFRTRSKQQNLLLGGRAAMLALVVVAVFGLSILQSQILKSPSLAAVISAVLVDLTNSDRAENALQSLTVSPVLTRAAQAKADDMAAKSYFAHVTPEGRSPWYWFEQEGYAFAYAGENLAVDFSDSADVERAWMNSPTHRRNILDRNFTEIGIATARGTYKGRPTTFVVQMFGTPARSAVPAPVTVVEEPAEPTELAVATTESEEVAGAAAAAVTGAEPAPSLPVEEVQTASWWEHLLTTPKATLQYSYYALAVLILILLAYVTELEFHRRHMRHVVATACLFVLMIGLFTIADAIFFAQPVIAALVMRGV